MSSPETSDNDLLSSTPRASPEKDGTVGTSGMHRQRPALLGRFTGTASNSTDSRRTSSPATVSSVESNSDSDFSDTPCSGSVVRSRTATKKQRLNKSWPGSQHERSNRELLEEILRSQSAILDRLEKLEEKQKSSRGHDHIVVPHGIRIAVKDGYNDGLKRGLSWDLNGKPHGVENEVMSGHVDTFVKGLHETSQDVINCAIGRYFKTKKQEATLKRNNQYEASKMKRVKYERKKEKAKRRLKVLDTKSHWPTEKRAQIKQLLSVKFTSSDEEGETGFVSHPPSWASEKFNKVKASLDKAFLETCSTKSRRLLQKRTIGAVSEAACPEMPECLNWAKK